MVNIFNAVVFGAFVGFLTDFWLGRANVSDPAKLVISVIVGAVVAVLVLVKELAVF